MTARSSLALLPLLALGACFDRGYDAPAAPDAPAPDAPVHEHGRDAAPPADGADTADGAPDAEDCVEGVVPVPPGDARRVSIVAECDDDGDGFADCTSPVDFAFCFCPKTLRMARGDVVVWTNMAPVRPADMSDRHSVTEGTRPCVYTPVNTCLACGAAVEVQYQPEFDSGCLDPVGMTTTYAWRFCGPPRTVPYYCKPHAASNMRGQIVVE